MKSSVIALLAGLVLLPAAQAADQPSVTMGELVKQPSVDTDAAIIISDAGVWGCKTGHMYVRRIKPKDWKPGPGENPNQDFQSFLYVPDKQKLVSTKEVEFQAVCLISK